MDSSPSELITLRSPFNGETVTLTPESCSPVMLDAMIQAGFVRLSQGKRKYTPKEAPRDGTSETVGR